MAANRVVWSDQAISLLLEALQSRESLWNTRAKSYHNRVTKKKEYDDILDIVRQELPDCDLASVKAKIQGLRTTYREEVRKIKKSQSTGSGASDVYTPKWKYYQECGFLEEVIISSRPSFSNLSTRTASCSSCDDDIEGETENATTLQDGSSSLSLQNQDGLPQPKKVKRPESPWMETAAQALNDIAKGAAVVDDEWDIFGRDVANTLRGLGDKDVQRRVKFAIQSAIYQATEPATPLNPPTHASTSAYPMYYHADSFNY